MNARLILAHSAISDLAWIWREMPAHRNLFIDSSWWHPSDLLALFSLVAPGHILWASDSPYGDPAYSASLALRCALQAGLGPPALRGIMGDQLGRIVDGREPNDFGPPPGPGSTLDPLLERVVVHLTGAVQRAFAHADPEEPLGLGRLACAVGTEHPHARVASEVLELLDGYERLKAPPRPGRVFPDALRLVVMALVLAHTPDVALPVRPDAPAPVRAQVD